MWPLVPALGQQAATVGLKRPPHVAPTKALVCALFAINVLKICFPVYCLIINFLLCFFYVLCQYVLLVIVMLF